MTACALPLFIAACTNGPSITNRVLVIDKAFDLKTADPHREFDVTGALVAKALYSTLLTFNGKDESTPVPSVASSFTSSDDARTFTFNLRRDILFSDGTLLTSADVVFSFNRVVNLKSSPSFLLAGVSASAPDASTVVLKSRDPNPALPYIVTNPALGIVNSALVKIRGGTDAPGADQTDIAESFLDHTSAGSGPYILQSFSTFSDVKLTANPRYWGAQRFFGRVVIRNMDGPTQLAYIPPAIDEIALDLSPAQAGTVGGNGSVRIEAAPGSELVYLFSNENPQVSAVTSNKHFQNAVRDALDYGAMVQLTGAGAVPAPGLIPSMLLGALPSWVAPQRNLDAARAELAASGLKNPAVSLAFASDMAVSGLPVSALASMVEAELGAAGIKVSLHGAPASSAMADYAAGREQMGLWSVRAQYADPNYVLDFLPGRTLGLLSGWLAGADPSLESLGLQAATTADATTRAQLFQNLQGQLNSDGPFVPLVQPGYVIVASRAIQGIEYNPSWSLDVAAVTG